MVSLLRISTIDADGGAGHGLLTRASSPIMSPVAAVVEVVLEDEDDDVDVDVDDVDDDDDDDDDDNDEDPCSAVAAPEEFPPEPKLLDRDISDSGLLRPATLPVEGGSAVVMSPAAGWSSSSTTASSSPKGTLSSTGS